MAKRNKRKFYCYVDESGQDTAGQLFIVSVVVAGREARDQLEKALEELEQSSGSTHAARSAKVRESSKRVGILGSG